VRSVAKISTFILLFHSLISYSQKQADRWYFGQNAGLDFSAGTPEVIQNSNMIAESGCTTISDSAGNLFFYSNGINVWNRQHQILPNGDSLKGSSGINQNSLFIPWPGKDSLCYLFTIDSSGFYYSLINGQLHNGMGDIIIQNSKIRESVTDKITACRHCNSFDTWVIVTAKDSASFYSYLITENGLSQVPTVSHTGIHILSELGYMKASPSGDKLVLPLNSTTALFAVFDFDNLTGLVSNPMVVPKSELSYAYGAEFSPDSKVLYISTGGQHFSLLQYDLSKTSQQDFVNSVIILAAENQYALQLANDGKIYVAHENESCLGVINFPSILGSDCQYKANAVDLSGNQCQMGLPNFNQSYFNKPVITVSNSCLGDTTRFVFDYNINIDSVQWDFGFNFPVMNQIYPFEEGIVLSEPGQYKIQLKYFHCGIVDSVVQTATIFDLPAIDLGNDTSLFAGNSITLDAGNDMDHYCWNTGSDDRYLTVLTNGIYYAEVTKNNCISTDSIQIRIIPSAVELPNAFSPNGDNVNEIFKPIVLGKISEFQFTIYNRFGERIFLSNDYLQGWDGNFKGRPCHTETYLWEISYHVMDPGYPSLIKQNGTIHLLR